MSSDCEEDLVEMAAVRFCRENPGYLRNILTNIVTGKAYSHITLDFFY